MNLDLKIKVKFSLMYLEKEKSIEVKETMCVEYH